MIIRLKWKCAVLILVFLYEGFDRFSKKYFKNLKLKEATNQTPKIVPSQNINIQMNVDASVSSGLVNFKAIVSSTTKEATLLKNGQMMMFPARVFLRLLRVNKGHLKTF